MALSEFDVLGEEVWDEETDKIVKKGDPRLLLVRYQPDGGELLVSTRINSRSWRAAASHSVLLLKPSSRENEVLDHRQTHWGTVLGESPAPRVAAMANITRR